MILGGGILNTFLKLRDVKLVNHSRGRIVSDAAKILESDLL